MEKEKIQGLTQNGPHRISASFALGINDNWLTMVHGSVSRALMTTALINEKWQILTTNRISNPPAITKTCHSWLCR